MDVVARLPARLQATFVPGDLVPASGHLALWGFADTDAIVAAADDLDLPQGEARTLETVLADADGNLEAVDVPARFVPILPAVRGLAVLPPADDWPAWDRPSDSLLAWSVAAKLALEVTAAGRIVPTLKAGARADAAIAHWRGVPPADGRLDRLAAILPAVAHAVRRDEDSLYRADRLLGAFLDAVADTCAREGRRPGDRRRPSHRRPFAEMWADALTSDDPVVTKLRRSPDSLVREITGWSDPLLGRDLYAAARLALRLEPPEAEDTEPDDPAERVGGVWRVHLLLQAADDPSTTVPAAQVWDHPGGPFELEGRRIQDAHAALVLGIAQAARLFPPFDTALDQPRPTEIEFDTSTAAAFLDEAADALDAAGIGVEIPAELEAVGRRRLRPRLRVGAGSSDPGAIDKQASGLFTSSSVADFRFEIALGDETITRDEFASIAALQQPLVRWRGQWVRVRREDAEELIELEGRTGEIDLVEALVAALAGQRDMEGLGTVETVADGQVQALIDRLRESGAPTEPDLERFEGDLRPYQERGVAWLQAHAELGLGSVLADQMGLGKAQPLDAKVLTPDGWKRMGDLQVGDEVMNPKGSTSRVIGVFPQGEKDAFRVEFSDGSATECCDEHLWRVNTPSRRWAGSPGRVLPLRDIRERQRDGAGNRQHFIPMVSPVEHPQRDFLLDPYLLGVLLGDGCLTGHSVVISTVDEGLLSFVGDLLPDGVEWVHKSGYDYRLSSGMAGRPNRLIRLLRELGLQGLAPHEKQIPGQYLVGSVDQRTALLQGLLDTDGHVRPADNNVEFSSTSRRLAEDVQSLVQSLGGTAHLRRKQTTHRDAWRMSVALPAGIEPFRLGRKADVYRPREKYPPSRSIDRVVHVGRRPMQCIAVDHPDGLYVTDDYIVTHNTPQAIALMAAREPRRPHLVVGPTSIVGNWEREIRRFAPDVEIVHYHGQDRPERLDAFKPGSIAVTSYALMRRDVDFLMNVPWDVVVFDEAQQIKNVSTKGAKAARALDADVRVAMTGTPVENRLSELWAIIDLVNPGLLGPLSRFTRQYAVPIERWHDEDAASRLRRLVAPFLMRREKADPEVSIDLPEKEEVTVACSLSREQAALYQAAVDEAFSSGKLAGSGFGRKGRVLALLTALKQICNHPAQYLGEKEPLPGRSGKLARATEILGEVVASGDRALVFTQYKQMGDLLMEHFRDALDLPEVPFLHGSVRRIRRDEMVARFQEDADAPPILIVSLRAGGTGLNLTRATEVIHYDRWWNPAVEDQAADRAHRIGQTRNVTVHTLIAAGTVEDRIAELLERKRELADAVIGSGEAWITELGEQELRDLVALSTDDVEDEMEEVA